MTTHEAAAAAGRTATTIRNWIARGALAAAMVNGRKPGRPYKTAPVQAEGNDNGAKQIK